MARSFAWRSASGGTSTAGARSRTVHSERGVGRAQSSGPTAITRCPKASTARRYMSIAAAIFRTSSVVLEPSVTENLDTARLVARPVRRLVEDGGRRLDRHRRPAVALTGQADPGQPVDDPGDTAAYRQRAQQRSLR